MEKRFWYEEGFTPSKKNKILIFDRKHLGFIIVFYAIEILLGYLINSYWKDYAFVILKTWCIINFSVLMIAAVVHFVEKDFSMSDHLPIHLCNINLVLLVLYFLTMDERIFDFVFTYAMLGAGAALLFPNCDAARYPRFCFRSLEYFSAHTALTIIPLYIRLFMNIDYKMSNMVSTMIMFVVFATIDFIINMRYDSNYFFIMHAPDGSPVTGIEKKYGPIVYRLCYIVIMLAVCLIMHLIFAR